MTDTYLRSLGFAPTKPFSRADRAAFSKAWRYQYDHVASDGSPLFLEHPLGIDACWLSSVELPLAAEDVTARLGLHDRPGLEAAMTAFFAAHGGIGTRVSIVESTLRPLRHLD